MERASARERTVNIRHVILPEMAAIAKNILMRCRKLEAAKRSHNYRQYALLLETGLRTSEMIGLTWDSILYKLCDEAGIGRFCMHALRHTYTTRAIEAGMQPKVLQQLLGHASIKTTMDRYVHVTDDSLTQAVLQFELHRAI